MLLPRRGLKPFIGAGLSLALFLGIPGLPFYEALAQVLEVPGVSGRQTGQVPVAAPAVSGLPLSPALGGLLPEPVSPLENLEALPNLASPRPSSFSPLGGHRATENSAIGALRNPPSRLGRSAARRALGAASGRAPTRGPAASLRPAALHREWSGLPGLAALGSPSSDSGSLYELGQRIEAFLLRRRGSSSETPRVSVPVLPGLGSLSSSMADVPPGSSAFPASGAGASSRGPPSFKPPVPGPSGSEDAAIAGAYQRGKIARAYRRGKLIWNLKSAAALSAMAGITAFMAAGTYLHFGWAGFKSTFLLLGWMFAMPMIQELLNRLARKNPPSAPKLDPQEHPELYRMVAELSVQAGLKMPELLLWDMDAPNAAATGIQSPVLVTRSYVLFSKGILKIMKPEELAGVVGHELSHIRHYDIALGAAGNLLGLVFFLNLFVVPIHVAALLGLMVAMALLEKHLSRSREYLADLGGAFLTGSSGPLASGLLRLDIWMRLVAGVNTAPVGAFSLESLTTDHPPTLWRAEAIRRLLDPLSPAVTAKTGSKQAWMSSLDGFLSIVGPPMMWVAMIKTPFLWALLIILPLSAAIGILKIVFAQRSNAPDMVADRFLAYLSHPDPALRGWSAAGIRKIALQADSVGRLTGVGQALSTAAGSERDAEILKRIQQADRRVQRRIKILLERSRRDESELREKIQAAVEEARREGRIVEDRDGQAEALALLLKANPREPAMLKSLPGPSTLAAVVSLKVRLVQADAEGAPFFWEPETEYLNKALHDKENVLMRAKDGSNFGHWPTFHHMDPREGELYVSRALWDKLSPRQRAGLLYRQAAALKAERGFASQGRIWTYADPQARELREKINGFMPMARSGGVKAVRLKLLHAYRAIQNSGRPNRWSKLKEDALNLASEALSAAQSAVGDLSSRLSAASLVPALAWGLGFSGLGLQLGAGLPGSLLTGAAAFFAYARLRSLPWPKRPFLNTLAWFAPLAVLALAGLAAGHAFSFALEWPALTWFCGYMLEGVLRRQEIRYLEVLPAALWTALISLSVFAGDPYGACKLLVAIGFYFHLARHGKQGPAYLWAGAALAAASWGLFLAGYPGFAFLAILGMGHVLGGRLTKGMEPAREKREKKFQALTEKFEDEWRQYLAIVSDESKIKLLGVWPDRRVKQLLVVLSSDPKEAGLDISAGLNMGDQALPVVLIVADALDHSFGPLTKLERHGLDIQKLKDLADEDASKRKAALEAFEAAGVKLAEGMDLGVHPLRRALGGDVLPQVREFIHLMAGRDDGKPYDFYIAARYPRPYGAPDSGGVLILLPRQTAEK